LVVPNYVVLVHMEDLPEVDGDPVRVSAYRVSAATEAEAARQVRDSADLVGGARAYVSLQSAHNRYVNPVPVIADPVEG
jgi:hypothetical protein